MEEDIPEEESRPRERNGEPRDPAEADSLAEEEHAGHRGEDGDMVGMIIPASEAGARESPRKKRVLNPVTPTSATAARRPQSARAGIGFADRRKRIAIISREPKPNRRTAPTSGGTSRTSIFDVANALPQKTIVRTSPA